MRQKSFIDEKPTLYLVPTPIGNLDDMTFRSIKILNSVDTIFCEDTRVSRKILNHFEIDKSLQSYHEHNKEVSGQKILALLDDNKDVALISDAGMPIISDPGYEIVKDVVKNDYHVVALPGANAALTALITSGITPQPFTFYGFLSNKKGKREKELESLKHKNETLIFYESPHRITDTLKIMKGVLGDRQIALAREITKKFEEIIRGSISQVIEVSDNLKGEMVLIVEGNIKEESYDHLTIIEHINMYIKEGKTDKEAIKQVAKDRKLAKNEVYKEYHQ